MRHKMRPNNRATQANSNEATFRAYYTSLTNALKNDAKSEQTQTTLTEKTNLAPAAVIGQNQTLQIDKTKAQPLTQHLNPQPQANPRSMPSNKMESSNNPLQMDGPELTAPKPNFSLNNFKNLSKALDKTVEENASRLEAQRQSWLQKAELQSRLSMLLTNNNDPVVKNIFKQAQRTLQQQGYSSFRELPSQDLQNLVQKIQTQLVQRAIQMNPKNPRNAINPNNDNNPNNIANNINNPKNPSNPNSLAFQTTLAVNAEQGLENAQLDDALHQTQDLQDFDNNMNMDLQLDNEHEQEHEQESELLQQFVEGASKGLEGGGEELMEKSLSGELVKDDGLDLDIGKELTDKMDLDDVASVASLVTGM